MKLKRFEMRLDESELTIWRKRASEGDLSLAEWIRDVCNSDIEAWEEFERDHKDTRMRTAKAVPMAERSVVSSGELCDHEAEFGRCKEWGCWAYEVPNGRRGKRP